ncbi:MAG: MBL fold metallo-hydrolase [Anaerolineae bacterium]|nr:MBL fold metallo-hydrolase [Anaerolineae bacterium]
MQEIAAGVVVSTEFRLINVGAIAAGSGLICIDVPPYPEDARRWRSWLLETFKQPIRLVVLTDSHRDRLPGLHWFEEARIIAHDATYDVLAALPGTFIEQTADALSHHSEERASFSGVRLRLPQVTFNDRMTAFVDDFPLPLTAMPGPTPGNVWVHLPDRRVVFTGDSVAIGQPPQMGQVRSKAWLNSLTRLRRPRFAADVIVPGRGPLLADKGATQGLSEFVRYMRRRVQYLYRAGHARAEVLNILPDLLAQFELPSEDVEAVQRRFKLGLESIYDEFRRADDSEGGEVPPPSDDDEDD